MVSFNCNGCGDVVKKPKLDTHFQRCSASVTCLDCSTQFNSPSEWKSHTSCISEAEKYEGSTHRGGGKKAKNGGTGQQQHGQAKVANGKVVVQAQAKNSEVTPRQIEEDTAPADEATAAVTNGKGNKKDKKRKSDEVEANVEKVVKDDIKISLQKTSKEEAKLRKEKKSKKPKKEGGEGVKSTSVESKAEKTPDQVLPEIEPVAATEETPQEGKKTKKQKKEKLAKSEGDVEKPTISEKIIAETTTEKPVKKAKKVKGDKTESKGEAIESKTKKSTKDTVEESGQTEEIDTSKSEKAKKKEKKESKAEKEGKVKSQKNDGKKEKTVKKDKAVEEDEAEKSRPAKKAKVDKSEKSGKKNNEKEDATVQDKSNGNASKKRKTEANGDVVKPKKNKVSEEA
ncbi:hypothetical protein CBS101457_000684 [Exobasidium rhododendri]|nr:hypothetical protein CBS101457_000684 [Exobasidium rhododendri]